jgi:predicted Zn-dependent peptidase
MLNRTIAPPIIDPVAFEIKLPACKKYTLSNGVEVYAVDMGTEDVIMVNWVFSAGNWFEKKKAVAAATNFLLKNGTSRRNAFEINEFFDYYGSYLNRACYNETADITLHTLSKHVNELLPVVAELVQDAVFPQEEINTYVQNAQQRLKVNLQKGEFVAGRLIDAYLFGEDHPYGKYMNLEDYPLVTREDVVSFYNEYYKEGRCVIFVAGKLPAGIIELLEQHFGQLPLKPRTGTGGAEAIQHPVKPAAEKKYQILNDPDGVQSAIRIARHSPTACTPIFRRC